MHAHEMKGAMLRRVLAKRASIAFAAIVCMLFLGCGVTDTDREDQITIRQGVWGRVYFWEGDFMPVQPTGTITPVVREILVFTPTTDDSVASVGQSGFCSEIYTRMVAETRSSERGFFQLELPPGKYSFFVREDSLFYANLWDGEGHRQPATVVEDSVTERRIDITYKATF